MKIKFVADDIASVLTEYYILLTNQTVTQTKQSVMRLHMKQAILQTYQYLFDDVDEIWMIDIWDYGNLHTYELNHAMDYDSLQMHDIIYDIKNRLRMIVMNPPDRFHYDTELITFRCVPFDGFTITTRDIVSLLDIDCM